mgnify:CR=1 FL=1
MPRKYIALTDQLRQAILSADKTRYAIWKETGVAEATLSRFVNGKGGLSSDAVDRIGECLGLWLTTEAPKQTTKKGRK